MQLRLFKILFLMIFIGFFTLQCQNKLDRTVARIDNQTIKQKAFVGSLSKNFPNDDLSELAYDKKLAHLNTLIDKKLVYVAAIRSGLDQRQDLLDMLNDEEMRLSYMQLLDNEIVDNIITEKDLKEGYKFSKFNLKVRRFSFPLDAKASSAKKDSLLKKVQNIRMRLLKGEDFELVAQAESLATAGQNTGVPEVLNWLHARTDKELFRATTRLPLNSISRPIQTTEGLSLVQVLEKQPQEVKDYASEREKIRNGLIRQHYQELNERFESYKTGLLKKYNVQIQNQNVNFLITKVKEAIEPGPNVTPPDKIQFDKLTVTDKEKALVTFAGGGITINRAIDLLKRIRSARATVPVFDNPQALTRYLEMIIPQEVIVVEAFKRKINQQPRVQTEMADLKERILSEELERAEVTAKATPTEADMMAYYDENKGKFVNEATYKVQEIFVTDENLARQIAKRAQSGENFDRLADKYSVRTQYKKEHGVMGFITASQFGAIGKTAAQMQVGSISEPVKLGNNWSVLKLLEIRPETGKTFAEARPAILQELKPKMLSERKEQWLKELRGQISVAIYDNVLIKS